MPSEPESYAVRVGDKLSFEYSSNHNVWLMPSLAAYEECDFSAATDANIGRFAFVGCERLVKLTLPAALSRINNGTFSRCSALVELTLPITVTSIGTDAFDQCTSLAELTLPATLTSIGDYAFSGCTPPHTSSLTHSPRPSSPPLA